MTRSDIHSEARFNAADYEPVGYFDRSTPEFDLIGPNSHGEFRSIPNREYDALVGWLVLLEQATTTPYGTGAQCDHCGAAIRYAVVMLHKPTGDYLAVGETCAAGRFTYSAAKFAAMRKSAAVARKAAKFSTSWQAFMADHAEADWAALYASTNSFVQDVLRKGRAYGTLSDRQFNAITLAVVRDAQYATERAARDAADALKARTPAPTGRVTITGTVLSTKFVDSAYGSSVKMLVEATEGFKVWSTAPSSLNIARGDVVRFDAEVTPSRDDEFFAFAKRPTKAVILEEVNA